MLVSSVVYHKWLDILDFSCKTVADAKSCQRGGPVRGRSKSTGELGESPIHSAAGSASLPHFVNGCRWQTRPGNRRRTEREPPYSGTMAETVPDAGTGRCMGSS